MFKKLHFPACFSYAYGKFNLRGSSCSWSSFIIVLLRVTADSSRVDLWALEWLDSVPSASWSSVLLLRYLLALVINIHKKLYYCFGNYTITFAKRPTNPNFPYGSCKRWVATSCATWMRSIGAICNRRTTAIHYFFVIYNKIPKMRRRGERRTNGAGLVWLVVGIFLYIRAIDADEHDHIVSVPDTAHSFETPMQPSLSLIGVYIVIHLCFAVCFFDVWRIDIFRILDNSPAVHFDGIIQYSTAGIVRYNQYS